MTSAAGSHVQDRLFRQVFATKPINVREAGRPQVPPLTLGLRAFPFPFRSALAVSNATEAMSAQAFDHVHRAFAERNLELEATLSFGPQDVCAVGSGKARELSDAGLAGSVTGLPSGGADEAVRLLSEAQLRPTCYVGNPAAHIAAPLAEAGVRYFTDSSFVVREKFGEALDLRSTARLVESFGRFDYDGLGAPEDADGTDLAALFAAKDESERRELAVALFNSPFVDVAAKQGEPVRVFKRFRGDQRPAATTFAIQTRSLFLDALETLSGAVVIEQRFGETALIGQSPGNERRRPIDEPFGQHELIALDELAERSRDRLLVTTPPRLLDWLDLRANLQFEVDQTNDLWLIRVTGFSSGASRSTFDRSTLEGLAFQLPANAPKVVVQVDGQAQPLSMSRDADPFLADHDCLYLPWEKRLWPIS